MWIEIKQHQRGKPVDTPTIGHVLHKKAKFATSHVGMTTNVEKHFVSFSQTTNNADQHKCIFYMNK